MGLDKKFIEKAFADGKDRVNRAIFVKPEELIELSDEDLSYFGEGIFYCLPRSKFVESHKDEIREKYNLGKINKYLNETGKEFKELTILELKQFERVK